MKYKISYLAYLFSAVAFSCVGWADDEDVYGSGELVTTSLDAISLSVDDRKFSGNWSAQLVWTDSLDQLEADLDAHDWIFSPVLVFPNHPGISLSVTSRQKRIAGTSNIRLSYFTTLKVSQTETERIPLEKRTIYFRKSLPSLPVKIGEFSREDSHDQIVEKTKKALVNHLQKPEK